MLKPVVAAAAVLAIAGSSFVYAQQRSDGPGVDGGPRLEQRQRPSLDDIHAFADARIAALKAGLQLTPEQDRNWPAFEQAVRDLVKLRVERRQAAKPPANGSHPPIRSIGCSVGPTPCPSSARRSSRWPKPGPALPEPR
jgi:zinc resistance-associated protein